MRNGGNADNERGTLSADVVVAKNLASVLLDDAIADTQAETGSLSDFLGGEERIENFVRVRDPIVRCRKRKLRRTLQSWST